MSWRTIHEIIGLAVIDENFAKELLNDPLTAIQKHGFILTPNERAILSEIKTQTLQEFSQLLLHMLDDDDD